MPFDRLTSTLGFDAQAGVKNYEYKQKQQKLDQYQRCA